MSRARHVTLKQTLPTEIDAPHRKKNGCLILSAPESLKTIHCVSELVLSFFAFTSAVFGFRNQSYSSWDEASRAKPHNPKVA